jgi:hypothetical protein
MGAFVEFLSGWKLRHERIWALAKFGNFSGICGVFLLCLEWFGSNRNYFLETEGHAAILPLRRDCSAIYKNLTGLFAKGKEYGFSWI